MRALNLTASNTLMNACKYSVSCEEPRLIYYDFRKAAYDSQIGHSPL